MHVLRHRGQRIRTRANLRVQAYHTFTSINVYGLGLNRPLLWVSGVQLAICNV